MEPRNDGGPNIDEALLNPKPGAHEAFVMVAQSPASETWNHPASHWLIQQRLDLIKLPEDEHGADVVSERELELHPSAWHDLTDAVYGVIAASKTVIVAMVPSKTSEILSASAWGEVFCGWRAGTVATAAGGEDKITDLILRVESS